MPSKYTKEILEPIVKESNSWAEVCRKLKIKEATGAQTYITNIAKKLELNFLHFTGKAWNKGKRAPTKVLDKHLVESSTISSHKLKLLLIKTGRKEAKCEICSLTKWNGEDIVLELDHINSEHSDNRIENIQIVCPNCHAQETRKRRKKIKADVGELVDPPDLDSGALIGV